MYLVPTLGGNQEESHGCGVAKTTVKLGLGLPAQGGLNYHCVEVRKGRAETTLHGVHQQAPKGWRVATRRVSPQWGPQELPAFSAIKRAQVLGTLCFPSLPSVPKASVFHQKPVCFVAGG